MEVRIDRNLAPTSSPTWAICLGVGASMAEVDDLLAETFASVFAA